MIQYNIYNFISCLLLGLVICVSGVNYSQAEMKPMNNNEMEEVTAQKGFATFNVNGPTAEAILGAELDIEATFDSWKWGHWDNGNGLGWDNKWPNVKLHEEGFLGIGESGPMKFKDFFIEAGFQNDIKSTDPGNRKLNYMKIGFRQADGSLNPDDFEIASMIAAGEEVVHRDHLRKYLIDINKLAFRDYSFEVRIQLRKAPHEDNSNYEVPKGIWAETDASELSLLDL